MNEIKLDDGNSIHDPYEFYPMPFNNHFSDISPKLANEIHVKENGPSHVDYLCGVYDCIFEPKTTSVYPQFSCFHDYKLSKTKQQVWAT